MFPPSCLFDLLSWILFSLFFSTSFSLFIFLFRLFLNPINSNKQNKKTKTNNMYSHQTAILTDDFGKRTPDLATRIRLYPSQPRKYLHGIVFEVGFAQSLSSLQERAKILVFLLDISESSTTCLPGGDGDDGDNPADTGSGTGQHAMDKEKLTREQVHKKPSGSTDEHFEKRFAFASKNKRDDHNYHHDSSREKHKVKDKHQGESRISSMTSGPSWWNAFWMRIAMDLVRSFRIYWDRWMQLCMFTRGE